MNKLAVALEVSVLLAEKVASAHPASDALRQRSAMADFATFGLYKQAALDPHLMKGLMFGAGVGLPALGVGHLLLRDARHQGESLIRDARNQALLTAAGVGGMQSLGEMLKSRLAPKPAAPAMPPMPAIHPMQGMPASDDQKLAAAILVDDILEQACGVGDDQSKHAALVALIVHRSEATELLRSMLP